MNNDTEYLYSAFISYKQSDAHKLISHTLQKLIETYRVPKELTHVKVTKNKLKKVFLDITDLSAVSNLPQELEQKIASSEFLIVLCSTDTITSKWVILEIEAFLRLRDKDHIVFLITEGNYDSSVKPIIDRINETSETQDKSIKKLNHDKLRISEPLAINISDKSPAKSIKKLNLDKLKIISRLVYCDHDELLQRDNKRKKRNLTYLATLSIALSGIFATLSIYAFYMKTLADNNAQAEYRARINAQHNLVASKLTLSVLEHNNNRYRASARYAKEALLIEKTHSTKLALWDTLSYLPEESVYDTKDFPGLGLAIINDNRVAVASKTGATLIDKFGTIEKIPHEANMNLDLFYIAKYNHLLSLDSNGKVTYLNLNTNKVDSELYTRSGFASVGNNRLAIGGKTGLSVYDIKETLLDEIFTMPKDKGDSSVAISNDGNIIYYLSDNAIHSFDINTRNTIWSKNIPDGLGRIFVSTNGHL